MRQRLLYFPHELKMGERAPAVAVEEKPSRVWTLYEETDPDREPELPIRPVHLRGAFLEDYVHDWNWKDGQMRYYTRVMPGRVWLLLEYED